MNMPSEIKAAIEAAHGGPVEIVDEGEHYIVMRAELYERLKQVVDSDDLNPADMRGNTAKVMQDDWNDPEMDSYDTPK